jgi:hypothetical protein
MSPAAQDPRRPPATPDAGGVALRERLAALGRELAGREREHAAGLARAWQAAGSLHRQVAEGLEAFHAAVREAGAPQLEVELDAPRADEKHLRAVQFEVRRGRHTALVTVKSRGEVTLVGPFRAGKAEGPCKSFPIDAEGEIEAALGEFLAAFLVEAATP